MSFPHAIDILDYWQQHPPENEVISLMAQVYTTWRPDADPANVDPEASAKRQWAAGAMNPKQLFEALGGNAETKEVAATAASLGLTP